MDQPAGKIAYCAPGRETISALSLAWKEIEFDEVRASAVLKGSTDIVLIDSDAISEAVRQSGPIQFELTSPHLFRYQLSGYWNAPVLPKNSLSLLRGI